MTTETARTTASQATLAANRAVAIDFLMKAARGEARDAMAAHAAPGFVHHNPWFASDADSLAEAMDQNAREHPQKTLEILRTVAEGDLVALHARVRHSPADRPAAVVHIARFENGRIRELWDVGQEEPDETANAAGMF